MQHTILNIERMDDEGNADSINQLLAGSAGVQDVRVSLRDSVASVLFDEAQTSPHLLTRSLTAAGFPSTVVELQEQEAATANGGSCCGGCCGG